MGMIHLVRMQNLPNESVSDDKIIRTYKMNDPLGKLLLSMFFLEISINAHRGVFWTLSNISDEAVNGLKPLVIVTKRLHHRCLKG